jgi:hypothetical protein
MSSAAFPALPLQGASNKTSRDPETICLEIGERNLPVFKVRIKNKKVASLIEDFPINLYPIRTAYLPPKLRSALKLGLDTDLLVEARMPELLGEVPLAHWQLNAEQVVQMAEANAQSGALVLDFEVKRNKRVLRVFSPYWLDWQGWSGFAWHLARNADLADEATRRYLVNQLKQRSDDPPTALYTAHAMLLTGFEDDMEAAALAAEACQQEILLHLTAEELPTIGALDALIVLGQLLHSYDEQQEAHAALSLALWLNPNHQQANINILPLLEEEEILLDCLVRLNKMPQAVPTYKALVEQSAQRMGVKGRDLEKKIKSHAKQLGSTLWSQAPTWLDDVFPVPWVRAILPMSEL